MTVCDLVGFVASGFVFLTFCMTSMVPLRIIAIAGNLAFIAYAVLAGLPPVLLLHAALLPTNLLRLLQACRGPEGKVLSSG